MLSVVLCQGAALHFVDGMTGMKDFDVWTFFAEIPGAQFPPRWRTTADFGLSRFGRRDSEPDWKHVGRRVDFVGRSLHVRRAADPRAALQAYLTAGKTESARLLAEKAAVTLTPSTMLGEVIWPPLFDR